MNKEGYKDPTAEQAIYNVNKEQRKPWREVTAVERNKVKKEKCQYCKYSTRQSDSSDVSTLICYYIGKTGHSRGCSPLECDKFERNTKRRRKKRSDT